MRVGASKPLLETQLGSWLYHTQLCPVKFTHVSNCNNTNYGFLPRRSWPLVFARLAIWSAPLQENCPREGSVASYVIQSALAFISPKNPRSRRIYPFHTVSRCDLTEHSVVAQDSKVRLVRQLRVVSGRAEVELALGLGDAVDGSRSGSRVSSGGGDRRCSRWWSRRRRSCRRWSSRWWGGGSLEVMSI